MSARILALAALALLPLLLPATAQPPAIQPIAHLPLPLSDAGAFASGDAAYFFAGLTTSAETPPGAKNATHHADVHRYDAATDRWITRDRKLEKVSGDGAVAVDGVAYLAQGFDLVAYDPRADTLATAPDALAGVLGYRAAASDGAAIWYAGGLLPGSKEGGEILRDAIVRFDLANRTSTTAPTRLPHPMMEAAAVVANGEILLFGGKTPAGASDKVLAYDPTTGTIREDARLPRPAHAMVAVRDGRHVYLLGGIAEPGQDCPILRFDLTTGQSAYANERLSPRPCGWLGAARLGGDVLVAGFVDETGRGGAAARVRLAALTFDAPDPPARKEEPEAPPERLLLPGAGAAAALAALAAARTRRR